MGPRQNHNLSVGISAFSTGDCTAAMAVQAMLHLHDRSAMLLRDLPQLLDNNEMGTEMSCIKTYLLIYWMYAICILDNHITSHIL